MSGLRTLAASVLETIPYPPLRRLSRSIVTFESIAMIATFVGSMVPRAGLPISGLMTEKPRISVGMPGIEPEVITV